MKRWTPRSGYRESAFRGIFVAPVVGTTRSFCSTAFDCCRSTTWSPCGTARGAARSTRGSQGLRFSHRTAETATTRPATIATLTTGPKRKPDSGDGGSDAPAGSVRGPLADVDAAPRPAALPVAAAPRTVSGSLDGPRCGFAPASVTRPGRVSARGPALVPAFAAESAFSADAGASSLAVSGSGSRVMRARLLIA